MGAVISDTHFTEKNVEDLIEWLRQTACVSIVAPKSARLHFAAEVAKFYLEYRRERATQTEEKRIA